MTQKRCEVCGRISEKVVCVSHMTLADTVIETLQNHLFRMARSEKYKAQEHKRLEWDYKCLRAYVKCLHEDVGVSEEAIDRAADRADGLVDAIPMDTLEPPPHVRLVELPIVKDGPPLCATCGGEGSIQHLQYEEDCPDCDICEKCNGERHIETPEGDVDCTNY